MSNNQLTYKDYHANWNNNILNIYDNKNELIAARAFSEIIYEEELEPMFKKIIDSCLQ